MLPLLRIIRDVERELLCAPPVLTDQQIQFIQSPAFTRSSNEWARLRYEFMRDHAGLCQCCGRGAANRLKLNVDHIHPRKTHPHFALGYANLQILCSDCNKGKGNRDRTDWRFQRPQLRPKPSADPPSCPECQAPMLHRKG